MKTVDLEKKYNLNFVRACRHTELREGTRKGIYDWIDSVEDILIMSPEVTELFTIHKELQLAGVEHDSLKELIVLTHVSGLSFCAEESLISNKNLSIICDIYRRAVKRIVTLLPEDYGVTLGKERTIMWYVVNGQTVAIDLYLAATTLELCSKPDSVTTVGIVEYYKALGVDNFLRLNRKADKCEGEQKK